MLDAALDYAERGWRVFPVARGTKDRPLLKAWQEQASCNPVAVEAWWTTWPDANIAIATGGSGLVVVDIDPRHNGDLSLAAIQRKHEPLETYSVRTPSGGTHYYYRAPAGTTVPISRGKLGEGIDVQAGNTYVLAPPSTRPEGPYAVVPSDMPVLELPPWLVSLCTAEPRTGDARAYQADRWADGGRNAGLTSLGGRLRRDGVSEGGILAALAHENTARCVPPLPAAEVATIAKSMGRYVQGDVPGDVGVGWGTLLKTHTSESLDVIPRPRNHFLTDASTSRGVMLAGKVSLLAAKGGTGKSQFLIQLAVAVASGRTLFGDGVGLVAKGGRVLVVFAEEDSEEVDRRLHYATRGAGVASEVRGNVTTLALAGLDAALTTRDDGAGLPVTAHVAELQAVLSGAVADGRPYTLLALDPLSRMAGPDVEVDNSCATRFIQVLEGFIKPEYGSPTVLVCHHVRKPGKDEARASSASIRGASALHDGVRWAAVLEKNDSGQVVFTVVKGNGVKPGYEMTLDVGEHGVLVAAGAGVASETRKITTERRPEVEEKILQLLRFRPMSGTALIAAIGCRDRDGHDACRWLQIDSKIGRKGREWVLAPIASRASQSDGSQSLPAPKGPGSDLLMGVLEALDESLP